MANQKPLYVSGGTTTQLSTGDGILAAAIDASSGTLSIGTGTASAITIGIGGVTPTTATVAGNLIVTGTTALNGTVNTTGTTTFTTNATFNGNVTFGDGSGADTVTFNAATVIASNMAFGSSDAVAASGSIGNMTYTAATAGTGGNSITVTHQLASATPYSATVSINDGFATDNYLTLNANTAVQVNLSYSPGAAGATLTSGVGVSPVTVTWGGDPGGSPPPPFPTYTNLGSLKTALENSGMFTSVSYVSGKGSGSTLPNAGSYIGTLSGGSAAALAVSVVVNAITVSIPSSTTGTAVASFLNGQASFTAKASAAGTGTNADTTGNVTLSGGSAGGSPTYKITNLAAGTNPNDAVIYSQISSLVTGVSSVSGSGGGTGLTLSGGPSGDVTLTLGGTLAVGSGGTGAATLTGYVKGSGTSALTASATIPGSDISGNISGNAANVTGTVAIANGGTGQTSATAAFDALAPTTTAGDTIYFDGTDNVRLAIGAQNTVLRSTGSAPAWGSVALTTDVSGTLPVGNGGTGAATLTGYVKGSGTSAFTASATIPGSDISGNISGNAANVTGTVAVANGGTGQTTYDNGELLIGNSTGNTLTKGSLSAGTGITITPGAGTIQISATGTSTAAPVIDLITTGLTAGDVAYVSANDTASAADATAASTARCAGFVSAVGGLGTGKVQVGNVYVGANFIAVTGLAAGQAVYLSKTAGKLTNDVTAFGTGNAVAEVGIVTKVSNASGGAAAADVLWQPKSITVL